jgi:HlyD family type I secretion membrane fusion protein
MGNGAKNTFLTRSVLLEETGTGVIVKLIIYGTFLMVAGFIVWSIYMPLDEVAMTNGELVPKMRLQEVQHPNGGVIKKIYVSNGDKVKTGDLLLELDSEVINAKISEAKTTYNFLLAKRERLEAYLQKRKPNFSKFPPEVAKMINQQTEILQNLIDSEKLKYDLLETQIDQANDELSKLKKQKITLDNQIRLINKELEIQTKLEKLGAVPKLQLIKLKRSISQIEQSSESIPEDIAKVKDKIAELALTRDKIKTDLISKFREKLEEVIQKLPKAKSALENYSHDLEHLKLYANVSGTIHDLQTNTNGGVLRPMITAMKIVPDNEELVAEVHVAAKDIGHIKVGDSAKVRLTTFDFSRFGAIKGKVINISASSYLDKHEVPYYLATVKLEKLYININGEERRLMSGMSVEADIKTGTKTLMKYLLRPIFKSASQAFSER